MGKYTITAGQNIFDVSLHIYGSVEGIIDLMMCNPELSLDSDLKAGDQLSFTDDYIIDKNIVSHNNKYGIVPANGERNVYYKEASYPLAIELFIACDETIASFGISGQGEIEIDWGDNSPLQVVHLNSTNQTISHYFDDKTANKRRMRIYGDFSIQQIDLGGIKIESLFFIKPVKVENILLNNYASSLSFIALCKDILTVDLTGGACKNLLPLVECKGLMTLNLSKMKLRKETLDNYLIALANNNLGRRSCTITLTESPNGIYAEPQRNENLNYVISTGMEAIWVIVNEPAWNEAGYWKFTINEQIYTSEQ